MTKSRSNPDPAKDSRIHVLFIIDQLCEPGGAERMLLNTIRLLPKDRFRASLITFKFNPRVALFANLPCPHYVYPLRRTFDASALAAARRLRKFIRTENVQVVQTFHETSDLWAGFISKLSGVPVLISSRRDMGILRASKHNAGNRMMNHLFDRVLTVSEEVRQFCIQQDGLAPEKVSTLYNGLELETISGKNGHDKLRQSLGLQPATPVVITVGHIRRVKGIDVLVETAAKVVSELPETVFLVIGRNSEPEHFEQIQRRIESLGIARNIRFVGEMENIMSLLPYGNVFFLPSRSEGFSNALLEAMACRLPCVATRVGGNAEAIEEGKSGYLVENEDASAAAARIVHLLNFPEEASRISEAGRQVVETKFTANIMIERLVHCYDQLLTGRTR